MPIRRAAIVFLLAAITAGLCLLTDPPTSVTSTGVVLELPDRIGPWTGIDKGMSEAEKKLLPPDTQLVRKEYVSPEGDHIDCAIVLAGAEKRSIHRPEICLPAQGWTVRSGETVPIPLASGHALRAENLTITRNARLPDGREAEVPAYYLYWFVGDGVTTPDHWHRIWITSWDRIVHRRNHRWAYVIFNSVILGGLQPGGKDAAATLEMVEDFAARMAPHFQKSEGAGGMAVSPK